MTSARSTFVFASAGSEDDPLTRALVAAMTASSVSVVVIEPGGDIASAVRACSTSAVVGGFSRGARAAVEVARAEPVRGLVCLGYPFHPRGSPGAEPERISRLASVDVDTLVIQGERDAHGDRPRARGYALPENVRIEWIEDGNHRFAPRDKARVSLEDNLARVVALAVDFLRDR